MKNILKKSLLAAVLTTGLCLGTAVSNQANAWVCEGTTLYQSHGWWIFQFKYGTGMEGASQCEGY